MEQLTTTQLQSYSWFMSKLASSRFCSVRERPQAERPELLSPGLRAQALAQAQAPRLHGYVQEETPRELHMPSLWLCVLVPCLLSLI